MYWILLSIISVCYGSDSFSYDDDSKWESSSNYCGLTEHQSPKDINTASASENNCCSSSNAISANTLHSIWSIESETMLFHIDKADHHTVKLVPSIPLNKQITLTIKGIKYCYDGNVHFHWGENNEGSEHRINGKQYALEAHYIHYKCEYESVNDAITKWKHNGEDETQTPVLAVVGIFFKLSTNSEKCAGFDKILHHFNDNKNFALNFFESGLIPKNDVGFYNYHGSTTTPKCYPTVNWIVAESNDDIIIAESQLEQLRTATGINRNWRSIQNNAQSVYTSTCLGDDGCSDNNNGNDNNNNHDNDDHNNDGNNNGNNNGNNSGNDNSDDSTDNNHSDDDNDDDDDDHDCDDDEDDDEMSYFIKRLQESCQGIDGLTDHSVFQSAIEKLVVTLSQAKKDGDIFDKISKIQIATLTAWTHLHNECNDALHKVEEDIRQQRIGRDEIIKSIKQRNIIKDRHELDRLKVILPHIGHLVDPHPNHHNNDDCVDCDSSSNPTFSLMANSLSKLQLLNGKSAKAKSNIFNRLFHRGAENHLELQQIIAQITEKINQKNKDSLLFAECIELASDKLHEIQLEGNFHEMQQELKQMDLDTVNTEQNITNSLIETIFKLQHDIPLDDEF